MCCVASPRRGVAQIEEERKRRKFRAMSYIHLPQFIRLQTARINTLCDGSKMQRSTSRAITDNFFSLVVWDFPQLVQGASIVMQQSTLVFLSSKGNRFISLLIIISHGAKKTRMCSNMCNMNGRIVVFNNRLQFEKVLLNNRLIGVYGGYIFLYIFKYKNRIYRVRDYINGVKMQANNLNKSI